MPNVIALVPGDILVFTSDDSHVDHIICLLTNSDVAHSAIYYGKDTLGSDILVDAATDSGIAAHLMQVLPPGQSQPPQRKWNKREIYVRRLKTPPSLSLDPVLKAANKYVHENNGFNWMGLISLGLHLLFREGPLPETVAKLLAELLKMLTKELSGLIPHKPGAKGPHPMYCSQLVYQCFTDGNCRLQITQGAPRLISSPTVLDWIAGSSISLATLQAQAEELRRLEHRAVDDILDDLEEAIRSDVDLRDKSAAEVSRDPDPDLVLATLEFGQALQQVQEVSGFTTFVTGLHFLRKLQDEYVTPADLKDHCSNLEPIGTTVSISRNREDCPI